MANENFLRTYTMKCGKKGKKGFEIGNVHNSIEDALHISFSIEKCDVESPNTAKVQVWNLSKANLKVLDRKNCILELKAGYDGNNALVLVGSITSVTTTPDNADQLTEIEVMDGQVALRDTKISLSINGKVSCKDLYKKIAKKMGLPIKFASDLTFKKMPNGFSFSGKAKKALKKVAKYCKHSWSIQNEVIQIKRPGRSMRSTGFLLSSDTGLISIPKKITIAASSDSDDTKTGWEVQYLLNGAIGVNDVIKMKSGVANGYFLVHKVTMDGDNLEGDWVCTAQLLKIKASSKLDKKKKNKKKR